MSRNGVEVLGLTAQLATDPAAQRVTYRPTFILTVAQNPYASLQGEPPGAGGPWPGIRSRTDACCCIISFVPIIAAADALWILRGICLMIWMFVRPSARLRQVVGVRGGEDAGDLPGAEISAPRAGAPLERHRRPGALQVRHRGRTLDTGQAPPLCHPSLPSTQPSPTLYCFAGFFFFVFLGRFGADVFVLIRNCSSLSCVNYICLPLCHCRVAVSHCQVAVCQCPVAVCQCRLAVYQCMVAVCQCPVAVCQCQVVSVEWLSVSVQ